MPQPEFDEGPYVDKSIEDIVEDFAVVRGDLETPHARHQLVKVIESRIRRACLETARQADAHYVQLLDAAVKGQCGYSGLTLRECQSSICDCFDLPRVNPD